MNQGENMQKVLLFDIEFLLDKSETFWAQVMRY